MRLSKLMIIIMCVSMTFLTIACGTNGDSKSAENKSNKENKELVVVSWGGDYQEAQQKAMFDPYSKDTGNKLIVDSPVDIGKLKAMVQSGDVQWDVVDVLGMDVPKLVAEGLLEPIDYEIVDKSDLLEESVTEYSVGIDYYSTVLAYNKENLPNGKQPESWADFFDKEKFPGYRAMYKSPITTLEIALLADGVKPTELYPLDVDRAFKKLDTIKDDIIWWEQGAQPVQFLSDKEVIMAAAWNGRIVSAANQGQSLEFTYNQGILDSEAWVVPNGTKNKDLAMEFINYVSKAEQQAELVTVIPYGPTNTKALDLMDKDYAKSLPTFPDNYEKQILLDTEWWHENFDKINSKFHDWLIK